MDFPSFLNTTIFTSVFLLLSFTFTLNSAQAQDSKYYIAAYGGYAFSEPLKNIEGKGAFASNIFPDRDLNSSPLLGLKIGFIPGKNVTWFGIEGEIFVTSPRAIPQTNVIGTGSANFEVITYALNWVLRYPGERFQPYVGAGPSLVKGESDQAGGSATGLGLNLLAGMRLALSERLFVFSEYKYNRSTLEFSRVQVDYRLHGVVGGIGVTF